MANIENGDWWSQNAPDNLIQPTGQPLDMSGDLVTHMDTGVDPTRQFVLDGFAAKGSKPRDEADLQYWVDKINQTGGLGNQGNATYWSGRLRQDQGGAGDYLERPEAGGGSPLSGIGQLPTYQPPQASPYTPYNPGPAPTPTPFTAPTLEQARNAPGFQSAIETADQGIQRSAIARAGLSGGILKDIGTWNVNAADQNYGNLFNQSLAANQTNNSAALNAYSAGANANIGAGNMNIAGTGQQFQQEYQPGWNAYTFGANYGLQANQQQFGQGMANKQFDLGAQNQYWNQGFNENQNAYSQYDNSQKTAFDQWYKQAQLGNPGNPYT